MKKLFVIYGIVEFVDKPNWLDEYSLKYDEPYQYHITLKQPCYIDESDIDTLKLKTKYFITEFIKTNPVEIDLVFDLLNIDQSDSSDMCIMINSKNKSIIYQLQKQLVTSLSEYKDYRKPESKQWEKDFKPHLTIARNLDGRKLSQARVDLPEDYKCRAKIISLALDIVKGADLDSDNLSIDQTVYSLK